MGVVINEATFPDHVPPLSEICEQITAITSLPVVELDATADELYAWRATIAFEHATDDPLQLEVERPGALARVLGTTAPPDEAESPQTVRLRLHVGQEPTLLMTTKLALEALGGRFDTPISDDDRRRYDRPIREAEVKRRRRTIRFALLPVLIPLWILSGIWRVLTLPWRSWRSPTD